LVPKKPVYLSPESDFASFLCAIHTKLQMDIRPFDLAARAHQVMEENGFHPDLPPAVVAEARQWQSAPPPSENGIADLRSTLWSSIDNESSRDLDQIEFTEKLPDGTYRLLVAIADVGSVVATGSATDQHAASEATSVYTGVVTFPMLPTELSTDATSLREGQDRLALVIELSVDAVGKVIRRTLYPAMVRNRARLSYSPTAAWLTGTGAAPAPVTACPGMDVQLRLQLEISKKLRDQRLEEGSLSFNRVEATPVVGQGGAVTGLKVAGHNIAEDIIESFMVAANVAMAEFLKERKVASIRRVVKTPRRWDRIQAIASQYGVKLPDLPDARPLSQFLAARKAADPDHYPDLSLALVKLLGPGEYIVEIAGEEHEGHFGLAVHDYTHSTAPNRRFADLITQRLAKAASQSKPSPYATEELTGIAAHCTEREDAARKVERSMRKVIAANVLSRRIGEIFDAVVTGSDPKGTYVRLKDFPAEGRVTRNYAGIDVGDKVKVKLVAVEIGKGFIDFEKV
jgi:VacB/RNase II family 3'-5' exoribonuclease